MSDEFESVLRLRVSGLVDSARLTELFGDAVTEVLIRHDGDEGLSRVMTSEFLAPVRPGDYLEISAKLVSVGRTSRTIECTAHKISGLAQPQLVARATDIAVVPLDKQRGSPK